MIIRKAAGRGRFIGRMLTATTAAAVALCLPAPVIETASAQEQIGYKDFPVTRISGSAPSGTKPESKLWFNDGSWWGVLFDDASETHHIFRLDAGTQQWIDTGVRVDDRRGSRADVLWDGTKLYVASHLFTNSAAAGDGARLYRYTYNTSTDRYVLDLGYPVYINQFKTETLTIDKDTTGKLWATWTAGGNVYVASTTTSDRAWAVPFVLPVEGATGLATDDISSVVAFNGQIGVMWGTQTDPAYRFSAHTDGQPAEAWSPMEPAVQGLNVADDHINLKTTPDGRVFAAVKTSEIDRTSPLNLLMVRDPTTGAWTQHVFGTKSDRHTRPIVMIDETNQRVHMFATAGEAGGAIYTKSAPLDAISFPAGRGRLVMYDPLSDDLNDASGAKHNVTRAMGLPILASDDTTDFYWHSFDTLTLGAKFLASNTRGTGPLTVRFSDDSSGYPVSWNWDFGDGNTSTQQDPTHVYEQAGTYSVTLTVTDSSGETSTQTRANLVTVDPSVVFTPRADTYVNNSLPTRNYGTMDVLKVRYQDLRTVFRSFMSFDVAALATPVSSAKMRLYVNNASTVGGTIHVIEEQWTETSLTWNTQPAMAVEPVATIGKAPLGYVEVNLPASLFAGGAKTYSFGFQSTSPDDVWFNSRENAANPPQLVLGQAVD